MSYSYETWNAFIKLPYHWAVLHLTSKFIFGLGIGILLSSWFEIDNFWGWILAILAIILMTPSTLKILNIKARAKPKKF